MKLEVCSLLGAASTPDDDDDDDDDGGGGGDEESFFLGDAFFSKILVRVPSFLGVIALAFPIFTWRATTE